MGRDRLRMVGSIYEAFAVDEAAEGSLKRLVLPSSLLGVLLAWLCLRSVRGAAAVLIIAGVGQLLAVALVSATGGEFSAVPHRAPHLGLHADSFCGCPLHELLR